MLSFGGRSGLRRCAVCIPAFISLLCAVGAAQQIQVTFDPAQTKIDWTLGATMHTVHGTFKLKSGSVKFDPKSGAATGEIAVDATTGESGNHDRDADMHNKVLESARYREIVFLPQHVVGSLAEQGKSNLQVQGVFKIHGADHDLTAAHDGREKRQRDHGQYRLRRALSGLGHEEPQQDVSARGQQGQRQHHQRRPASRQRDSSAVKESTLATLDGQPRLPSLVPQVRGLLLDANLGSLRSIATGV